MLLDDIPKIIFAGFSNSGKTTLIEKILNNLTKKGLKVATIKHDAHGIIMDTEGKDSKRFLDAGASISIVSSNRGTMISDRNEKTLKDNISYIKDVDLIIIEGYKNSSNINKIIVVSKRNNGKMIDIDNQVLAIATDMDLKEKNIPIFELNDIEGISEFIIKNMHKLKK